MNTSNGVTQLVEHLAGYWTDPALESLKAEGIHDVSVDMELETWRTLKAVLCSEFRRQQAFRLSTIASVTTLMEQVIHRVTQLVARKFFAQSFSSEVEFSPDALVAV